MGKGPSRPRGYVYVYNGGRDNREGQEREPGRKKNEEKQIEIKRQINVEQIKSDGCEQRCDDEAALGETRKNLEELELENHLCQSRKELFDYKFGDKSTDLETLHPHVTQLRIALFGQTGSGKSCLINTCERAVRGTERGSAESSSGEEWTVTLQDHLPEMFFHLVDTRGFFNFDSNETVEFQNILLGKIQPGDTIDRPVNEQTNQQKLHQFPAFEKRVHGIIIVVKANDPRLQKGTLREYLQPVLEIIDNNGIKPITVVTHYDTLHTEEERKAALKEASEATDSSPSHTLFISNYTKENWVRNTNIERMALEILHRAVEESEKAVIRVMEATVPREILERGPLALEAYNKARSEGTTVVKRVPIMLIGQNRSGKTSLKKSLRGQPFDENEKGTSGIDVDPSFFKVSCELWKVGERDQDASPVSASLFDCHIAKSTVKNLSLKTKFEVGSARAIDPEDSDSKEAHTNLAPERSLTRMTSKETSACEEVPTVSENPDKTADSSTHIRPGPDIENDRESKECLRNVTEMLLQKIIPNEEDVFSMFWDFGGESVYYTTHPIFLTPKAIYLLVHDLSKDADALSKPVSYQGRYKNYTDSHCLKQNVDYLYFWMSLVASLANHHDSGPSNTTSKTLPENLPPVFLVCTHADEPFGRSDATTLGRSVYGSLKGKSSGTHLWKDFFVVDNTRSGKEPECSGVVHLRKEVRAACNELQKQGEAIPIKWLLFETVMKEKKEKGFKFISFEEARRTADEECDICDKDQFRTLMKLLHDQRILIHFDETPELDRLVVLDCQWLIDVFKSVITVKPYEGEDNKFAGLWKTFEEEGILKEELLKHVWSPLFKEQITCESLIAIMEKFSLLCSLPLSNPSHAREYLVPSMLMYLPSEDVKSLVESSKIPSLFIKFKSGQVPPGLFHRLVLEFFPWGQENQSSQLRPSLHQNYFRFYLPEKRNCSFILLSHSSSIEVVFHSVESADVSFVPKLRRQLELVLTSMRIKFFWLKSMRYEIAFICPVCCQGKAVSFFCTHKIRGCKQEECLHFWLESEINKESNCTKNATAEDFSVHIEKFAPWTTPTEIRSTDGTHAETQTAGDKEILKVEKFLSECTSDTTPDDFLSKLTTILELDQSALQYPDLATKTVFRILARKAKVMKRVDVFERLRNILPAGTTGPSLAEHIDVCDIPLAQRLCLTMHLSGGDKWKMVAEHKKLGLQPFEIQYFDDRHTNPFEAALSLVSKRRHLSVGSLYDLLNELGYPQIADLL